jgi:poly(3-hydroxybutyrate) depolymerase
VRPLRLLPIALVVVAIVVGFIVEKAVDVDRHGAQVAKLEIDSKAVGQRLPVTVVVPADRPDGKRPLLVFLHGRSGDNNSELDDAFFSALASLGEDAPLVAFPYGGLDSYWHNRDDGDWGRYVTGEVIPSVVRRFGADPRRVAIGGISMGGFGAYDIARLNPGRFCAVGGHSPALWATGGETAPGAFDDAEDFARHDVIAAARANPTGFAGDARLWLDAGASDPFQPGDQAMHNALGSRLSAHLTWKGGHEDDYWNKHWPTYAKFYARALAQCRR